MPIEASGEGGGLVVGENCPGLAPCGISGPYFRMVPEISTIDCLCSELSNNCENDGCRGPDCTASERT